MNMRGVIDGDPRMTAIVNAGLASGKLVCGHARGLEGADLNAFMASGITSDHELTSGADLAAKLSAGLTIEMRGSHDHLLSEFVEVLNGLGHLPSTVTLCTDDVFPDELQEGGGLDDVIRRLVRYGMKPEWAIRAATFNAAQRLKRSDLGLIATGRRADIVLFEDLTEFHARLVISSGRIVARNGSMEAAVQPLDTTPLTNSVKLPPLTEDDFHIPSNGERVRVATHRPPALYAMGRSRSRR